MAPIDGKLATRTVCIRLRQVRVDYFHRTIEVVAENDQDAEELGRQAAGKIAAEATADDQWMWIEADGWNHDDDADLLTVTPGGVEVMDSDEDEDE